MPLKFRIDTNKDIRIETDLINSLREEQINWIHGTQSGLLAILIQTGHQHLMPAGWLNDPTKSGLQCPLYPLSGARDNGTIDHLTGMRGNINSSAISGYSLNFENLTNAFQYAHIDSKPKISFLEIIASLHHEQLVLPSQQRGEKLKALQYGLMILQREMLLSRDWSQEKASYLTAVREAREKCKNSADLVQSVKNMIDNHLKNIETIIENEELPFKADEVFIARIEKSFPMIIGAKVDENKLSDTSFSRERAHEGSIPLDQIKAILVDEVNASALQELLKNLHLSSIKIFQYKTKEYTEKPTFFKQAKEKYSEEQSSILDEIQLDPHIDEKRLDLD